MSNDFGNERGYAAVLMQRTGTLVYAIFLVAAWIIGLAALGAAVVSYMIGAMEPVASAIGVLAGTSIVYLVVTSLVRKIQPGAPTTLENEPMR